MREKNLKQPFLCIKNGQKKRCWGTFCCLVVAIFGRAFQAWICSISNRFVCAVSWISLDISMFTFSSYIGHSLWQKNREGEIPYLTFYSVCQVKFFFSKITDRTITDPIRNWIFQNKAETLTSSSKQDSTNFLNCFHTLDLPLVFLTLDRQFWNMLFMNRLVLKIHLIVLWCQFDI